MKVLWLKFSFLSLCFCEAPSSERSGAATCRRPGRSRGLELSARWASSLAVSSGRWA